jgi:hypothetical protein
MLQELGQRRVLPDTSEGPQLEMLETDNADFPAKVKYPFNSSNASLDSGRSISETSA